MAIITSCIAIILFARLDGAPPADRQARGDGALFFFIQLSDPQLGFFEEDRGFKKESENLARAVAHINRLRPAFVVVTGDLINRSGDAEQMGEYLRLVRGVSPGIPLHSVPGNHDLGNSPTPASIAWFRRMVGPDHGAFTVEGWRFLFLDSTVLVAPKDCPRESEEERRWLREELARARDRSLPVVIFEHHPPFLKEPGEAATYFNFPAELRSQVLGELRRSGVRAVFAGHLHDCAEGRDGELQVVTSGPVGKPLGKVPSGLRIVWVYRDRLESRYYGLDAVPERVRLAGPVRRRL